MVAKKHLQTSRQTKTLQTSRRNLKRSSLFAHELVCGGRSALWHGVEPLVAILDGVLLVILVETFVAEAFVWLFAGQLRLERY